MLVQVCSAKGKAWILEAGRKKNFSFHLFLIPSLKIFCSVCVYYFIKHTDIMEHANNLKYNKHTHTGDIGPVFFQIDIVHTQSRLEASGLNSLNSPHPVQS